MFHLHRFSFALYTDGDGNGVGAQRRDLFDLGVIEGIVAIAFGRHLLNDEGHHAGVLHHKMFGNALIHGDRIGATLHDFFQAIAHIS